MTFEPGDELVMAACQHWIPKPAAWDQSMPNTWGPILSPITLQEKVEEASKVLGTTFWTWSPMDLNGQMVMIRRGLVLCSECEARARTMALTRIKSAALI